MKPPLLAGRSAGLWRRLGRHTMATVTRIQTNRLLMLGASIVPLLFTGACTSGSAQSAASRVVVRLAELEIEPGQLESYKALLREEIETSIRVEPGVLTLYAVAVKGQPTHIRLLETYSDQAAYEAHLKTPHFLKYKSATQSMVTSLNLLEAEPVLLGANPDDSRAGAGESMPLLSGGGLDGRGRSRHQWLVPSAAHA